MGAGQDGVPLGRRHCAHGRLACSSDASDEVDADGVSVGTAFQRFGAYRDGFLGGVDACEELLTR